MEEKEFARLTPTWILFFEKRETKANLVRDITMRKGRYGSFLHILLAGMSYNNSMGFFNKAAKRKRHHFLV